MLGFDDSGKISLLGHSAFSKGYYSVSFNNPETLHAFITSRHADFSDQQKTWLDWVLKNAPSTHQINATIARADR